MPSWDGRAPGVGEKAPDLALVDQEGKRKTLPAISGRKPLVLLVFSGLEDRDGLRLLLEYRDDTLAIWRAGAALCAIGPVEPATLRHLRSERGVGFPLLADPGGAVLASHGMLEGPGVFLLDGDGIVKHRARGDAAAPDAILSILRRGGARRSRPGLRERARGFAHALQHAFRTLRPAR
jgi:peroxiredoxin